MEKIKLFVVTDYWNNNKDYDECSDTEVLGVYSTYNKAIDAIVKRYETYKNDKNVETTTLEKKYNYWTYDVKEKDDYRRYILERYTHEFKIEEMELDE